MSSSRSLRSTQLSRSAGNTAAIGGCGVALLAGGASLIANGHPILAAAAGLGGVLFCWGGLTASGKANCPVCGQLVDNLVDGALVQCPKCLAYSKVANRQLQEIDRRETRKVATFSIPVPEGAPYRMPDLCCACAAPATHSERLTMKQEVADRHAMVATMVTTYRVSLDVPYCSAHSTGATLELGELRRLLADPGPPIKFTALKVPSYVFYAAFLRLNPDGRNNAFRDENG